MGFRHHGYLGALIGLVAELDSGRLAGISD